MTNEGRFERQLPDLLEALYLGSTPDYRDDVLARVARTRQRPAWTFPGRWFPMLELIQPQAPTRRAPWRLIVIAILVLLLIAAGLVAYVGSRPQRLPPPLGPAANGLLAYSAGDDIDTADPVTGASKAIFHGSAPVNDPLFSPDGTRLVFEEDVPNNATLSRLFAVNADGSGLAELTTTPLSALTWWDFATDGKAVLITSAMNGVAAAISIANTDGSGIRTLDVGNLTVGSATYRPGGTDILFRGETRATTQGIYLVGQDGKNLRAIVQPSVAFTISGDPVWSPDGSHVAYVAATSPNGQNNWHVHVVAADGSGDRLLMSANMPAGQIFDSSPVWSPDGTKLVIWRVNGADHRWSVVRADGTGPIVDVQTPAGGGGADYRWSPDGSTILARQNDANNAPEQWQLWNPVTGAITTAPVTASSYPTWQRVAP